MPSTSAYHRAAASRSAAKKLTVDMPCNIWSSCWLVRRPHPRAESDHLLITSVKEDQVVRADRLVSLLLLMRLGGRAPAARAAAVLEVSVPTARRDLEALAAAGVPVYAQP